MSPANQLQALLLTQIHSTRININGNIKTYMCEGNEEMWNRSDAEVLTSYSVLVATGIARRS